LTGDPLQGLKAGILRVHPDLAYTCHQELLSKKPIHIVTNDLKAMVVDVAYHLSPMLQQLETEQTAEAQWKLIYHLITESVDRDAFVLYELADSGIDYPLIKSAHRLKESSISKGISLLEKARDKAACIRTFLKHEFYAMDLLIRMATAPGLFEHKLKAMIATLLIIKRGLPEQLKPVATSNTNAQKIKHFPWWAYAPDSDIGKMVIQEAEHRITPNLPQDMIRKLWLVFGNEQPVGRYCQTSELWQMYLNYQGFDPSILQAWPNYQRELRQLIWKLTR
jgi:hypothetical protein